MNDDKNSGADKIVGSTDVLERAADHLRTMSPHVRERLTAQLLKNVLLHVAELEVENKMLRALATCGCGDGFTKDDLGTCVNCMMSRSNDQHNWPQKAANGD